MNTPTQPEYELAITNLKSPEAKTALVAHQQILKMGPSVVPQLLALLHDESETLEARSRVAKLLGDLKDPKALQPLIDTLLNIGPKQDAGLGWFSALGGLRITVVVEPESDAQRKERMERSKAAPNVRPIKANFISALGNYTEPKAIEALTAVLRQGDFDSQTFALAALAAMKTPDAVRAMMTIVDYPARLDPEVANTPMFKNYSNLSQLAFDLRKLGAAAAPALDLIIETLRKPVKGRFYLLEIVGNIGDARACDVLAELLNDSEAELPFEAAKTLAKLHDKRATPVLVTYLSNEDPKVRGFAVTSLGNFKDDEVVDRLTPLLGDKAPAHTNQYTNAVTTVGKFTLDTLKKIGTDRALAAVGNWEKTNA